MSRVQIADFFVVLFFVSAAVWNHCAFWASWSVVWLPSLYTLLVKFWFDLEEKVKKSRSFIALSSEMVTHVGDSLHLGFHTRGQTGIRLMLRLLVLRAVANIDVGHYFEDQMLEYQVRKCCRDLTKRWTIMIIYSVSLKTHFSETKMSRRVCV